MFLVQRMALSFHSNWLLGAVPRVNKFFSFKFKVHSVQHVWIFMYLLRNPVCFVIKFVSNICCLNGTNSNLKWGKVSRW